RDVQAAVQVLSATDAPMPDTLTHRLATFRARGIVAAVDDDVLTDDQWRALLIGFGVMPESWPPSLDAVPTETIRRGLRRILSFVGDKVRAQPTHDACLAEFASAV
ncbi:MAG: tryptophan 7-halogenase, partial [Sphingomonas sp.]